MARTPRTPTVIDPDDELDEAAEAAAEAAETERIAAGDIALFDTPEFNGYKWSIYRLRTPEELARDPDGDQWAKVGTRRGPIDDDWVLATFGGGTFELRGYFEGSIRRRPRITIDAPRRDLSRAPAPDPVPAVAPAPVQPVAAPLGTTDPAILRLLEQQRETIQRLEQRVSGNSVEDLVKGLVALKQLQPEPVRGPDMTQIIGAVAPILTPILTALIKPQGVSDLVMALGDLKKLSGGNSGELDPIKIVGVMMEAFNNGMAAGRELEPVPVGEDGGVQPLIAKGLDLLKTAIERAPVAPPAPRPPLRPPGGPPPPVRSEATVLATPAPTTPVTGMPTDTGMEPRWQTAIDSLYNAMLTGIAPDSFAETLKQILQPDEILQMSGTPAQPVSADLVLAHLEARFGVVTRYPALGTDQGKIYLSSVLAELRMLALLADDDEPAPASS